MSNEQALPAPAAPITNAAEAQQAIGRLNAVVDALEQLIEQESTLVRTGRLRDAAQLTPRKDELARLYHADAQRLKASLPRLRGEIGDSLAAVKARHAEFGARLQGNLTVLATAHAVSESIIRGLSQELTRKAAPRTYGASGRPTPARAGFVAPLAMIRTL